MEIYNVFSDFSAKVIQPLVRLDTNNSAILDKVIMSYTENAQFLIIDLSLCHYLSSSGIRVLLKARKSLFTRKGELFLTGVSSEVYQIIELVGLHHVFKFEENPKDASNAIKVLQSISFETLEWSLDRSNFVFQESNTGNYPAMFWKFNEIAGYNELKISVGYGSSAESDLEEEPQTGLFVTTGQCAGFIPYKNDQSSDFRVSFDPCRSGILLEEAISFQVEPNGLIQLKEEGYISFHKLAKAAEMLKQMLTEKSTELLLLVIADYDSTTPSITVALLRDQSLQNLIQSKNMQSFLKSHERGSLLGASFMLGEWHSQVSTKLLSQILIENLNIENISEIQPFDDNKLLKNPLAWIFLSKGILDAADKRLVIETSKNLIIEPSKSFLIRRLYTDSAKVIIEQLHGGYSAQTFQVTSYDSDGRKMRPTVLKVANRKIISRESDRCKKYAMPYIFNNSAVVLGAEYYGETGALRYNFVGIGGEDSRLKWLTHYYQNNVFEVLEPIFDKIFLQILKPWYGQPVDNFIYPFKDHDPTLTFFSHIYQTVDDLFSISSDEKFITISESSRPILNPYWFLKHEFPRRRETDIHYFSSICHGDLNMQNILLDENKNIYLIDFSETKPRSIISDFARLEAIFLVDNAPVENENDMCDYLLFISNFYNSSQLYEHVEIIYNGRHQEKVLKNAALAIKMREYAFQSVNGNQNPIPYYIALLEWVVPIVCYTIPIGQKRLSMIVASILSEKIIKNDSGKT